MWILTQFDIQNISFVRGAPFSIERLNGDQLRRVAERLFDHSQAPFDEDNIQHHKKSAPYALQVTKRDYFALTEDKWDSKAKYMVNGHFKRA